MLSTLKLSDEIGLYPYYPSPEISKLLLTKNRTDANLLLEQKTITAQYNVLALCGREGLSDEHMIAFTDWAITIKLGKPHIPKMRMGVDLEIVLLFEEEEDRALDVSILLRLLLPNALVRYDSLASFLREG